MTFQHTPHEVVLEAKPPAAVQEIQVAEVKTIDSEIHRLAIKYGQSETLARKIIACEGKQYKNLGNNENIDSNGNVWSVDVGLWQINDYYHEATARKMGLDLYNDYGNLEYGFYLMSKQGTLPWSASKYCWNK